MNILRSAIKSGKLKSSERENEWLNRIVDELSSLPDNENQFIKKMFPFVENEKCNIKECGL